MSGTATEFADKLRTAIEQSNFHLESYIWKGRKVKTETGEFKQEEIRLMDASPEKLKEFCNHSISMLYNHDRQNPGRYPLLDIIQSQKDRCGVELFLRENEAANNSRYTIIESIKQTIRYSGITPNESKNIPLSEIVTTSSLYSNLPIKLVQEGCMYRLGKFDKSHITLTFILKQGLRLTEAEELDLTEYVLDGKGNRVKRNFLEVVRERLNIADHMKLKIDSKGLTYTQLRAMLNLKSRFYNELTTEQLKTLRYIILLSLEDDVSFHIQQWEERLNQIKEVAAARGIDLGIQI